MQLVYSDDFNGPAGQAPNPANWLARKGRWGTSELQYYQASNAALDGNGNLAITVRNELAPDGGTPYTSAMLYSQGLREFKPPVRFAARIQAGWTPGLLPAFWLLGDPVWGEVDVIELPAQMGELQGSCHMHGPKANSSTRVDVPMSPADPMLGGDCGFHVYAADLWPDHIDWYVGSALVGTVTQAQYQAAGGDWTPFAGANPFYVLLNVAVGNPWTGAPIVQSVFPQTMLVDWVRAYSLP